MQVLTHAGEIGVASTKAFTTQITVLTMIALRLLKAKGPVSFRFHMYLQELELIPEKVKEALETNDRAKKLLHFKDALIVCI
jgi:glucosamine--fructose-6-phosphate aminotransferase (isomerizing)